MSALQPGDLVVVVRPACACPAATCCVGHVFTLARRHDVPIAICTSCKGYVGAAAFWSERGREANFPYAATGYLESTLKKIEPLADERSERDQVIADLLVRIIA